MPVLAKGLMRVSMAVSAGAVIADLDTGALISLGCGAIADMFDTFFILYDKELSMREQSEREDVQQDN